MVRHTSLPFTGPFGVGRTTLLLLVLARKSKTEVLPKRLLPLLLPQCAIPGISEKIYPFQPSEVL